MSLLGMVAKRQPLITGLRLSPDAFAQRGGDPDSGRGSLRSVPRAAGFGYQCGHLPVSQRVA